MTILPATYCPDCGQKLTTELYEGDRQPYCESCDRMFWQQPIPCADVVVVNRDQVLLIKRALAPHVGTWALPGGIIDINESPQEAAVRELHEETTVTADPNDLVLFDTYDIAASEGWHNVVIIFAIKYNQTEGTPAPGSDTQAAQFWTLEELRTSEETLRPSPDDEARIATAIETLRH